MCNLLAFTQFEYNQHLYHSRTGDGNCTWFRGAKIKTDTGIRGEIQYFVKDVMVGFMCFSTALVVNKPGSI